MFAINAYKDFQTDYCILNNIPQFLPISNTPLGYMHLICLGVVKKIILLWTKGPLSVRLNLRSINKISHLLMLLRNSTPSEFVRRPRSINDVKLWKAVEFRNFLLYTGPIVLRYILKKDIYYHFITLHVPNEQTIFFKCIFNIYFLLIVHCTTDCKNNIYLIFIKCLFYIKYSLEIAI